MRSLIPRSVPATALSALLVTFLLAACGGESNTPSEPTSPEVGSVRILSDLFFEDLHVGDTYQLEARVEDTNGNPMPSAPVEWSVEAFGSYTPPYISVSPSGLLEVESPMNFSARIVARAGDEEDETHESIGGWGYSNTTDPISGLPSRYATTGANLGAEGPPRLYIRCRERSLDLYVSVTFVTGSGRVRYRLDDGAARSGTWHESSDFDAVFYPYDVAGLAGEIAQADTLVFAVDKFGGGEVIATFVTTGLDTFLDEVLAPCL